MCDLHGTGLKLGEGANNESLIGKVFITHVDTSSWLHSILVFSTMAGAKAICRRLHAKNQTECFSLVKHTLWFHFP